MRRRDFLTATAACAGTPLLGATSASEGERAVSRVAVMVEEPVSVGDATVAVEADPGSYAERLTAFFDRNLETHRRIEAVGIETPVPSIERRTDAESGAEGERFTEALSERSEVTERLDCGFDAVAVFVADVGEDNSDLDTDLETPYGQAASIGSVTDTDPAVAYARDGPARSESGGFDRDPGPDILTHEVCHLYGARHEKAANLSESVCSEAGLDQCHSVMGYDDLTTCDGSNTRGETNHSVVGSCNRQLIQQTLQTVTDSDDPDGRAGATLAVDGSTSVATGSEVTFRFGKDHEGVAVSSWNLEFADFEDEHRDRYANTGGTGSLPVYQGDADGGETATYSYPEPGTYTAELVVTSGCGRDSRSTVEVEVASEGELGIPGATLEVDGSESVVAGSEVTFRFGKDREGVAVSSWNLEFADFENEHRDRYANTGGTGSLPVYQGGDDGGRIATYLYAEKGEYTAELTVTSEQDRASTSRVEVTVDGDDGNDGDDCDDGTWSGDAADGSDCDGDDGGSDDGSGDGWSGSENGGDDSGSGGSGDGWSGSENGSDDSGSGGSGDGWSGSENGGSTDGGDSSYSGGGDDAFSDDGSSDDGSSDDGDDSSGFGGCGPLGLLPCDEDGGSDNGGSDDGSSDDGDDSGGFGGCGPLGLLPCDDGGSSDDGSSDDGSDDDSGGFGGCGPFGLLPC